MHFVYPWFLLALLVLAIPIIIHLFQFRKAKTVFFPSIRFLKQVQNQEKSQEKLKHLLVMSCRLLAFAALVLAFALPFFGNRKSGNEKTYVSVFVDNSLSMESRNAAGFVFEEAKNSARELVKSYGNTAMFQVMGHNPEAIHAGFVNGAEAIRLIDELKISTKSTDIEKVRYRQEQSLIEQPGSSKALYIISDLQGSFFESSNVQPHNNGVDVMLMPVIHDESPNLTIDTAWLANPFALAGEKNMLYFSVKNYASAAAEELSVKLYINENLKGNANLNIEENGSAQGFIEFSMPKASEGKGRLTIDDAGTPFDNNLFFTLAPPGNTKIGVINSGNNIFLNSALKTASFLEPENKGSTWPEAALNTPIIWSGIRSISASQAKQILNSAQQGNRVILIPDVNSDIEVFNELEKVIGFPNIQKKERVKSKLKKENLQNPFFKQVFLKIPQSIEMPTLFEYFKTGGNTGNGEAVMSSESGEPFLLSFNSGKGKIYVFLSAWDNTANNFVQSSLFYPVFANAILKTDGYSRLYETTSSGKSIALNKNYISGEAAVELKNDKNVYVPEISAGGGFQQLYIGNYLNEPGYYTLQEKKNPDNSEFIALNAPRAESNPAKISTEKLEVWSKNSNAKIINEKLSVAGNVIQEKSKNYWKLFIWIAAFALLMEILVILFWDKLMSKYKTSIKTT